MTDALFSVIWADALTAKDPDAYVSDWALSAEWGDADDAPIPDDRVELLHKIYAAAHMSIKDIRAATGLTQAAFAQRHCIPKRTIENWESKHNCPSYLRLLLLEREGLLQR